MVAFVMFKFHYPARGRKLLIIASATDLSFSSNSITPQGDGNDRFQHKIETLLRVQRVQIPLPRKGTETVVLVHMQL